MRRLVDLVASTSGLLILSPLFAVLAVAVKLSSPGPVFHRGERIGCGGKPFALYKFRSMRVTESGPAITRAGDPFDYAGLRHLIAGQHRAVSKPALSAFARVALSLERCRGPKRRSATECPA